MINNDKIFSSESYNFDNEQSQEGIGLIVGSIVLGPYLLFALLIFLANIGEKISVKKDKNKMKKYYETNKSKINEIANRLKNIDLLNELNKINLMFRKNPLFIESEYDELCIMEKYYNTAEISSFSTNEKFIEYMVNNYMLVEDDGNAINFKLICKIVPKNVKSQDLINTSNDINEPCSIYSDNYLKKINNEINKLCRNSKIQYFEYKSCKISTNPDDWYEEFDNGLPIDVELQYTLDLNKIVKGK